MNKIKKESMCEITQHFLERFNARKKDKNKSLDDFLNLFLDKYKKHKKNPGKFKGNISKTYNIIGEAYNMKFDGYKIIYSKIEGGKLKLITYAEYQPNFLHKQEYEY